MFHFSLDIKGLDLRGSSGSTAPCEGREYDDELHDIDSILHDICTCLRDSGSVMFYMGGFGDDTWPVDVRTDLCILLEQISDLLVWLQGDDASPFALDMYEQGISRSLRLETEGRMVRMECTSWEDWVPSSPIEVVERSRLNAMSCSVVTNFLSCVDHIRPHMAEHEWFLAWRNQDAIRRCLTESGD